MLVVITNSANFWMTVLVKWPNFDPNILIMKLRIWVLDGFCCHRCCLFPKTPHCRGAPSKKVWDCRIPGSVSNLLRKVEKGRKQISTARHLYSRFAIYLGFGKAWWYNKDDDKRLHTRHPIRLSPSLPGGSGSLHGAPLILVRMISQGAGKLKLIMYYVCSVSKLIMLVWINWINWNLRWYFCKYCLGKFLRHHRPDHHGLTLSVR